MEERVGELRHILTTVFMSGFAGFLIRPVMTDVTVAAVCSGVNDSCSLAVYLTGLQQVTVGVGTMIMMPVMGNLADKYGIKALLTLPMCLPIFPPAILGYKRDKHFFYAFYIIKIISDMVCQGTVDCLAQAYLAKHINGKKRIQMFGVLAGVRSVSAVCATFTTRFLAVASIFQLSAISLLVGLVYMRVFLKERQCVNSNDDDGDLQNAQTKKHIVNTTNSSFKDMVSLITNSTILVQVLVVTFFMNFSQSGMDSPFMYYLKARFGFSKNDFAEIMLLVWIIGSISQLFILPVLVSAIGERRASILSVSWSAWVPYAATVLIPGAMFVMSSVCGLASRQVASHEQGKVQGSISGVKSFAEVVAPFVYSPLTALFLSKNAPFHFPGFCLVCIAFSLMIGFFQSVRIKDTTSSTINKTIKDSSNEEA